MYIAIPCDSDWIDPYKAGLKELGISIMELSKYGTIKVIQNAKKRTMKKRVKYDMLVRIAWRCASFSLRTHAQRLARTTESGLRFQALAVRKTKKST